MTQETLVHVFWERVKTMPERPAILHKVGGSYRPVIWREQGRVVELVAGGLMKLGVQPGNIIGIISNSRPHWSWADMAVLSSGAVTVPIYPTLAAPDCDYLLRHSGAVGLFAENNDQLAKILSVGDLPPELRFVVLFSGEPKHRHPALKIMSWEDLLKDGEVFLPMNKDIVANSVQNIKPDDLATIVYTSGTTGLPKGAMILHKNIYSVCQSMSLHVGFHPDDLSLSFLPLSHVYERMCGQFMGIYEGLVLAYAEAMETVAQNMIDVRPTVINGVPRFFEKIYNRIHAEIRNMPKAQQYLIRWALALGKRAALYREHAQDKPESPSDDVVRKIYRGELRVADRLVFSRIRRRFGGRVRFMCSGAAPLSPEVHLFFETIGLPILEGYGLTETCAPIAGNTPGDNRRGTVGRPLPGVQIKLAADGEILVKGPMVFAGYYKNPDATAESLKNGWFYTGDIGEISEDGHLRIKDRKKDIIITSGGKHIAPQFVENLFVGEGLIGHILIYGDRRKYITALITLNPDGLAQFAKQHNISYSSVDELVHHPQVLAEVEQIVQRKNQRLASFEQIKKFLVLDRDFSIESNELTPTLKLKRKVVTEKYRKLLDSLYEREDLTVQEPGVS